LHAKKQEEIILVTEAQKRLQRCERRNTASHIFFRVAHPDPDLDPHGSALIWVAGSGSDPGGQKWPTKKEKKSCFEFLDVLFWGLKASPVAWASFIEA
jgi:hypothetical protein